jgi:flavin reductase (DIM6/NTAB) family NADH-FMN oxidoreductase RutF
VSIECTLHSTLRLGDSTVVFGRVEWISVWESAVRGGRPRIEELRPLARLGGNEWSTIGEVRTIPRIPYATWAEDPSIGEQVRGS